MPITKSMSASNVIDDFVHSSNKMFSGDSKKKRIKRALGAYYSMHKGKTRNEANDDSDHDTVIQGKGKAKRFKLKKKIVEDIDEVRRGTSPKDPSGAYYSPHQEYAHHPPGKPPQIATGKAPDMEPFMKKLLAQQRAKRVRESEELTENKDCKGQGKTTPTKIKDPLAKKKVIKGNPVKEDAVDEKYLGFDKLKGKIAAKGGVRNPGAVAAAIGRKKYGKKAMGKASASGHSLKGHKTLKEDEVFELNRKVNLGVDDDLLKTVIGVMTQDPK